MKRFCHVFLWICLIRVRVSTNQVSLDSGRMLVSWSFDAVSDKVRFVVNASEAVGWIGFGFALQAPNNMNDYDVIMAGYHDSQGGYIYDRYAIGQQPPPVDASQDYNLTLVAEEDGRTILHFERARNTGDSRDIQLTDNTEVFFVWALHSTGDATAEYVFPFHDRKGSSGSKQVIGPVNVTYTVATSSEIMGTSPSVTNPSSVTSSINLQKSFEDAASLTLAMSVASSTSGLSPSPSTSQSSATPSSRYSNMAALSSAVATLLVTSTRALTGSNSTYRTPYNSAAPNGPMLTAPYPEMAVTFSTFVLSPSPSTSQSSATPSSRYSDMAALSPTVATRLATPTRVLTRSNSTSRTTHNSTDPKGPRRTSPHPEMAVTTSTLVISPSPSTSHDLSTPSNPDSNKGTALDDGPSKVEGKENKHRTIIILLSVSLSLIVLGLSFLGCFCCFLRRKSREWTQSRP